MTPTLAGRPAMSLPGSRLLSVGPIRDGQHAVTEARLLSCQDSGDRELPVRLLDHSQRMALAEALAAFVDGAEVRS